MMAERQLKIKTGVVKRYGQVETYRARLHL